MKGAEASDGLYTQLTIILPEHAGKKGGGGAILVPDKRRKNKEKRRITQ